MLVIPASFSALHPMERPAAVGETAQRGYEAYLSRVHCVTRKIIDMARPLRVVSKLAVYQALIGNLELGLSHTERHWVFERAWEAAANTPKRRYVDDITDPEALTAITPKWRPRTHRRGTRYTRVA